MALTQSSTYNIKDHSIIIVKALVPLPLLASGDDSEKFSYERDNETWNKKHDCDGNVAWSYNPAKGGKIMIKTLHTSKDANQVLQGLLSVPSPVGEILTPGLFDIKISDNHGVPLLWGNKCRMEKNPNASRGKEIGTLEWTILVGELLINESGVPLDIL